MSSIRLENGSPLLFRYLTFCERAPEGSLVGLAAFAPAEEIRFRNARQASAFFSDRAEQSSSVDVGHTGML